MSDSRKVTPEEEKAEIEKLRKMWALVAKLEGFSETKKDGNIEIVLPKDKEHEKMVADAHARLQEQYKQINQNAINSTLEVKTSGGDSRKALGILNRATRLLAAFDKYFKNKVKVETRQPSKADIQTHDARKDLGTFFMHSEAEQKVVPAPPKRPPPQRPLDDKHGNDGRKLQEEQDEALARKLQEEESKKARGSSQDPKRIEQDANIAKYLELLELVHLQGGPETPWATRELNRLEKAIGDDKIIKTINEKIEPVKRPIEYGSAPTRKGPAK